MSGVRNLGLDINLNPSERGEVMYSECKWCWSHPKIKDGMRVQMCKCDREKWNTARKRAKSNKNHHSTKMRLEYRAARQGKQIFLFSGLEDAM